MTKELEINDKTIESLKAIKNSNLVIKLIGEYIEKDPKIAVQLLDELGQNLDSLGSIDLSKLKQLKGIDGTTPEFGKDYFTDEEIEGLEDYIDTNIKTIGNELATQLTVTLQAAKSQISEAINSIPEIKNGKDVTKSDIEAVLLKYKNELKGNSGSPDSALEIVEKIKKVKGKKRLELKNVRGLPEIAKQVVENTDDIEGLEKKVKDISETTISIQNNNGEGSGSGHIIQEEGVPLTQRPIINFKGTNVTATDNEIEDSTDITVAAPLTLSTTKNFTKLTITTAFIADEVIDITDGTGSASGDSNSLTDTTIAFVDSNPDTITDSNNGFLDTGLVVGQTITVTGSASNNNTFTIASISAGVITLIAGDNLVAENAGANVTIKGNFFDVDNLGASASAFNTGINIEIIRNGLELKKGEDVIFDSATTLHFTEALLVGDIIKIEQLTTNEDQYFPLGNSEPADVNFDSSQYSIWLDETTNIYHVKGKDSNGNIVEKQLFASDNNIFVSSSADLPTPVDLGGSIGIAYPGEGKNYFFLPGFTTNIPFSASGEDVGSCMIDGLFSGGVHFTGTGAFFRNDATHYFTELYVKEGVFTGDGINTLFALDGPGYQYTYFNFNYIYDFASLGNVEGQGWWEDKGNIWEGFTTGLFADNNLRNIAHDNTNYYAAAGATGACVEYGSGNGSIQFTDSGIFPGNSSNPMIKINSSFTDRATLSDIVTDETVGADTYDSSGLDQTSPYVKGFEVGAAPDSDINIDTIAPDTQEETVIPAIGAKVLITKTNFASEIKERLSTTSGGVTTYEGLKDITRKFEVKALLEPNNSTKQIVVGGVHICCVSDTITFTNATNVVNLTAHGLSNSDLVTFTDSVGTLPAGLLKTVVYYVVNVTANTFQVSYASGGSVVTFTTDGSGTNTYKKVKVYGLPSTASIAANSPQTLVSSGLVKFKTGEKFTIFVSNTDDATNIDTTSAEIIIN